MNTIDTSWLDGLLRERAVKVKYEQLRLVKVLVSIDFPQWGDLVWKEEIQTEAWQSFLVSKAS